MNAAQKLISSHLVSGEMKASGEIAITIDQTLASHWLRGQVLFLAEEQNERLGRMPCIANNLSVKVRPWEFGSPPT